jgi:hypothetical protein
MASKSFWRPYNVLDLFPPLFFFFFSLFSFLVPLYDGGATPDHLAFLFSDADFRRLASWPLYQDGQEELPLDSIVSVGYTLSTYLVPTGRVLSSNIQFVIMLVTPFLK